MDQRRIDANLRKLSTLCAEMGLLDQLQQLQHMLTQEIQLLEQVGHHAVERRNVQEAAYVNRDWVRDHAEQLRRGPDQGGGIFDRLD